MGPEIAGLGVGIVFSIACLHAADVATGDAENARVIKVTAVLPDGRRSIRLADLGDR